MRGLVLPTGPAQLAHEGKLTQWRVPIKPQPVGQLIELLEAWTPLAPVLREFEGEHGGDDHLQACEEWREEMEAVTDKQSDWIRCPFGVPGASLYVREPWAWSGDLDVPEQERVAQGETWYRDGMHDSPGIRWRSATQMPKWASRTLLELESVEVERVQEIDIDGVCAEGLYEDNAGWHWKVPAPTLGYYSSEQCFANLWDSINGKREGCSWSDNPYVWVLGLKLAGPPPEGEGE